MAWTSPNSTPDLDWILEDAYRIHGILGQTEAPTASGAAFSVFFWPEKDTDSLAALPRLLNRLKSFSTDYTSLRPGQIAKLKLDRAKTTVVNFYPKGSAAVEAGMDLPLLAMGLSVLGLAGALWEESRR